jgi:flagellar basal body-associated protein FliL
MAHKRIDIGASAPAAGAVPAPRRAASGDDRKKNIILLSIAGVAFAIAGYFIYSTFFGDPGAPADTSPATEQAFQNAVQPPPPADSEPMVSPPGSGKQAY